ncbi:hypothetical protein [Lacinutrix sp. MedPE-SW]|uniref:hypothetical protein n=1 Tax=Lacinutrix sp. MedPE-SW TaxID=1860087 RepID=UPI0009155EFB|nr:hypothetical protein [Lacinutrix sp. MedPE-SW]OIQ20317.1 MAG: hypothetical protein BM549_10365 [Lacinutrix sp. MedPE-SW]
MKTLKITLVAIFSLVLFTAVLSSKDSNSTIVIETPNHEINKPLLTATVFGDKKKKVIPSNG